MAALLEGVKPVEQGIVSDLPLAATLLLVLMVSNLEVRTGVEGDFQLGVRLMSLIILDVTKDLFAIDGPAALIDDRITDLTDEHDKPRWRVVVRRISPDQEDKMHDRHEQVLDVRQLEIRPSELVELVDEREQVEPVVVGFSTSDLHLLLQLREWTGVSRFVLLEEL